MLRSAHKSQKAAPDWLRELELKGAASAAALGNVPRGLQAAPARVAPLWEPLADEDPGEEEVGDEHGTRVQFVGRYFLKNRQSIDTEIAGLQHRQMEMAVDTAATPGGGRAAAGSLHACVQLAGLFDWLSATVPL